MVRLTGIAPDAGDQITIDLSATGGFGYINAMEIEVIPEPTSGALVLMAAALGLLIRRRGSRP